MTSNEIRQKFLDFFKKKGQHKITLSSSLIPENDPTTLFTCSGMQQMVPHLLGEKHPLGKKIVDVQKCFRTQDIEEVGDNRHTTFFEMLGNWSFGDYFKKEQIQWIFDFLINEINLNPKNLYVTAFRGNDDLNIPRDDESVKIWQEVFLKAGIEAKVVDFSEQNGMQGSRIFYYDETKNWWSRMGVPNNMPVGEIGGPNSEMFWDFGAELKIHENSKFKDQLCHVNCDCGRFLEIGNNVFIEYIKTKNGFDLLPQKNVDFGGGLERITAAENNTPNIFGIDLLKPIIEDLRLKIKNLKDEKLIKRTDEETERIIADHIKGSVFLIADGVLPSNTEQGYVLRRILRRAIRRKRLIGLKENFLFSLAQKVIELYQDIYPELKLKETDILTVIRNEEEKFEKTISAGIKISVKILEKKIPIDPEKYLKIMQKHKIREIFREMFREKKSGNRTTKLDFDISLKEFDNATITGKEAFDLYQTYGIPIEMIIGLAQEKNLFVDKEDFEEKFEKHQEISRAGAEKKFGGHGIEKLKVEKEKLKVTKLHTATHLLLAALRKILGEEIIQKGSHIIEERLRFDFNWPEKLTIEQLKAIEDLVNQKISEKIPVKMFELSKEEAKKIVTVLSFDFSKYGDIVRVYKIGDFSAEFCGGPHVENTSELGNFKIIKQESCGAGVRRIKAVLIFNF